MGGQKKDIGSLIHVPQKVCLVTPPDLVNRNEGMFFIRYLFPILFKSWHRFVDSQASSEA